MANAFDQFDDKNAFDAFDTPAPPSISKPSYWDKYFGGMKQAGNQLLSTIGDHPLKSLASLPAAVIEPVAGSMGRVLADASAVLHSGIDKIPGSSYIGNFDKNKTYAQRKAEYETGIGQYTDPQTNLGKSLSGALGATLKPVSDVMELPAKAVGKASALLGASPENAASIEDQTNALANALMLGQSIRATNPKEIKTEAPIPSKESLKNSAENAYKAAENAGAVVRGESYTNTINALQKELIDEGLNPKLMPNTSAALEHIAQHEGPVTIKQLETYRKVARAAESNAFMNPADARMAGKITDWIDDYMENLKPSDIHAGNASAAVQSLADARASWSKYKKADAIDNLMEKAELRASQFSGSGLENAIRTEFRQFSRNDKKMRGFSAEEKAAINRVSQGGPIDNSLRYLGKLAPTSVVSGVGSAVAGGSVGGVPGALATMGGGALARYLATKSTAARANFANELVRRGANPPAPTISQLPGSVNPIPLLLNQDGLTDQQKLARVLMGAQ